MVAKQLVDVLADGSRLRTAGLRRLGSPEIVLETGESRLAAEAESFLRFVAAYLVDADAVLRPNETLAYGYWVCKFVSTPNGDLEVWELSRSGDGFLPGALLTLSYWRDQHRTCQRLDADFDPPRHDALAVVSPGALEGQPVQGVRYPSPSEMSGWWITAADYDGNIRTLRHEHLYHITNLRPDLVPYLALPTGFRFDLEHHEDVWFDRNVAEQPSA